MKTILSMTDETKDVTTLFLVMKIFIVFAIAEVAAIAFRQHAKLAFTCGLLLGVIVQNLIPQALNRKRTVVLLIVSLGFGIARTFVR